MLGNIHQLLPAMAGVMGVATVWADTGYLARTGPLPLRFREEPPAIIKHINASFPPPFLPPYFPPPTLISLPTPSMPATPPDTSQATNDPPLPGATTNGAALEFVARRLVDDPAPPAGPDGIVSPQMLLKYFTTSTNGSPKAGRNPVSVGVIAPLGFTPPMAEPGPMPPPSSKATYSNEH
jgi:hypothetical protein